MGEGIQLTTRDLTGFLSELVLFLIRSAFVVGIEKINFLGGGRAFFAFTVTDS